jgi:hypothetical protein
MKMLIYQRMLYHYVEMSGSRRIENCNRRNPGTAMNKPNWMVSNEDVDKTSHSTGILVLNYVFNKKSLQSLCIHGAVGHSVI